MGVCGKCLNMKAGFESHIPHSNNLITKFINHSIESDVLEKEEPGRGVSR